MAQEVLRSVAEKDPERGLALLQEEPWSSHRHLYFMSGVRGYLQALGSQPDWRQAREELAALTDGWPHASPPVDDFQISSVYLDKDSQKQLEHLFIDQVLTKQWAQTDLDGALDWYQHESRQAAMQEDQVGSTVNILSILPKNQRHQAIDWMEKQQAQDDWDDAIIVQYVQRFARTPPDQDIERLVAMPQKEQDRLAIVAMFATPSIQGSQRIFQHPTELLQRLVTAANLSAEEHHRWMETITQTAWNK